MPIEISEEDVRRVEEVAREQNLSAVWLSQRTGKITASNFQSVEQL